MDQMLYIGAFVGYLMYWHIRLRLTVGCAERCMDCQRMLGEVLYLKTSAAMYSSSYDGVYANDVAHIIGWLQTLRGELPDAGLGIWKTWQHVKTFKYAQKAIREEYADFLEGLDV